MGQLRAGKHGHDPIVKQLVTTQGADARLVNIALCGYIMLEAVVFVYMLIIVIKKF